MRMNSVRRSRTDLPQLLDRHRPGAAHAGVPCSTRSTTSRNTSSSDGTTGWALVTSRPAASSARRRSSADRRAPPQHGVDGPCRTGSSSRRSGSRSSAAHRRHRIGRPHLDDRPVREGALELGDGAERGQPARVDDGDPVAALRLVQVVRRDEHGRAGRAPGSSISRQKSRRDTGSTPPVGSSRKTMGGSCSSAQPSASRCRQPPDRSRASSRSRPTSPAISSAKRRRRFEPRRHSARTDRHRTGCSDRRSAARTAKTAATCSRCGA